MGLGTQHDGRPHGSRYTRADPGVGRGKTLFLSDFSFLRLTFTGQNLAGPPQSGYNS
jgi:hypothetical protein